MGMKMYDIDAIVQKYNEIKNKSGGGNNNFIRLESGDTIVRIVPFEVDDVEEAQIFVEYPSHFLGNRTYLCPMHNGGKCPVCEFSEILYSRGKEDADAQEMLTQIRQKSKFLFNAVHDGQLKVLEVGSMVAQGIMKWVKREEYRHCFDLVRGYNFIITKEGKLRNTKYDVLIDSKPTKVKLPAEPVDLNSLVPPQKKYDELKSLLEATVNTDAFPLEEEETPAEMKARFKREALAAAKKKAARR